MFSMKQLVWAICAGFVCLSLVCSKDAVFSQEPTNDVWSIDWRSDGSLIAIGRNNGTVDILNGATGTLRTTLEASYATVRIVAWNPSGSLLAIADYDGAIILWDSDTQQYIAVMHDSDLAIYALAWSPDGSQLASVNESDTRYPAPYTVKIWDVTTRQVIKIFDFERDIFSIEWSPNGNQLAISGDKNDVLILNTTSWEIEMTLEGHTERVSSLAWSPDGTKLVTATDSDINDTIKVWDINTGQVIAHFPGGTVHSLKWSPDGNLLAISEYRQIRIIDMQLSDVAWVIPISSTVWGIAWSPDSSQLAYGGVSGEVNIANLEPEPTPFYDDFESGTSNWTHPAGWLRINTLYHSPTWAMQAVRTVTTPYSLTLTLNTPLDLTGFTSPELTYWSLHRLYYNTEYGRVQISLDDGATWTTVQQMTNTRNVAWTRQRINLSAYAGQTVRLRFVFEAAVCLPDHCFDSASPPFWRIDDVRLADAAPMVALPLTEDFEGDLARWVTEGTWATTTETVHSGLRSAADSPGSNYAAKTLTALTLASPAYTTSGSTGWTTTESAVEDVTGRLRRSQLFPPSILLSTP